MTIYDFTVKRGTTFNGVRFTITLNNVPVVLTGADIILNFRKDAKTPPVAKLSIGEGLTVTGPTIGQFWIDEQIFSMCAGSYLYEIKITFSTGIVKTWITGTATITEDMNHE